MISAVDTNILLDILIPNTLLSSHSKRLLDEAHARGSLVIHEIVYAELASQFPSKRELDQFLTETGIQLLLSSRDALYAAGHAWRAYLRQKGDKDGACPSCGTKLRWDCHHCGGKISRRQHMLSDFLIGGSALHQSDRLLTRDRGYYRTYFKELKLACPE